MRVLFVLRCSRYAQTGNTGERTKAAISMSLLLVAMASVILPLRVQAAEGTILINTIAGPSVPGQTVMAGGNVNLYFGNVNFSSNGFSLLLGPNNTRNLTINDLDPYAFFDVLNLTSSSISTYTSGGVYKWLVGFNWVNGSIPENIDGGGGNYYVKAFESSAEPLAVTDTYLAITVKFEVVPNSGSGGAPIAIEGAGLKPFDHVNLTYYSIFSGQVTIASLVAVNGSGQFTYKMGAPDCKQTLGYGPQPESADAIIFGCRVNSTNGWYAMDFREYKRGLVQVGSEAAPTGKLFGFGTIFSATVSVGAELRVVGKWFYPGNVTILWDGVANIGTRLVSENGFFNTTITIPMTGPGPHKIVLRDANNVDFAILTNVVGGFVEFSPIQAAINAANPGDTVYVPTGHYYGHIEVNKTMKLVGENSLSTIIDGNYTGNVINVTANNVEISGFTIQNSGVRTDFDERSGIGIYATACTGSNISGNVIENNFEGLVFESCSNILISQNRVMNNYGDTGVRTWYSSDVTITENNISNNANGNVLVFYCSYTKVTKNQISNANTGLVVSWCYGGISVSENNITGNHGTGLALQSCHRNVFFGNNITNNDKGISFHTCSDNRIHHNNLINNTHQAYTFILQSPNAWDNGYPSGGNYWSDYAGADTNGDGIGDTPYLISTNNQDSYPLMEPFDSSGTVQFDHTIPAITIVSPQNKIYTASNIPLTFTVSGKPISWVGYRVDDGLIVNISGNTTLTGLLDGQHSVMVIASDVAGNTGSRFVYFTINTVPRITVLSPENKSYPTKDISLNFAINKAVAWTSYCLDGQANVTITGNTTLTGLPEGSHRLIVYANNTYGNVGSSGVIYFTVDTVLPNILILSPESKTYTTCDIPLTFTVSEPASGRAYSLDGQAYVTITGNTTLTGLSDGSHILTVRANDMAGNVGQSNMVYFTVAASRPSVSILSPQNKIYAMTDIQLTFTVNKPASWIGYSVDRQTNVTIAGNTTLPGLLDGQHSLAVYARDVAGNTGASSIVYFTVDTVLPSILILSPENKTYTTTAIALTLTINEPVTWIGYCLDGQAYVTIAGNTTLTDLLDGSHSLRVYANDTAGNMGASETLYFTIALPSEPFPTTWIVATTAVIAIGGVAFLAYFRRIRKTTGKANRVKE